MLLQCENFWYSKDKIDVYAWRKKKKSKGPNIFI